MKKYFITNFKRKSPAGILLYTMVIALVFCLILQFSLRQQMRDLNNLKAERSYLTAQLMYSLAKKKKVKSLQFDEGSVSTNDGKSYQVKLSGDRSYFFGA